MMHSTFNNMFRFQFVCPHCNHDHGELPWKMEKNKDYTMTYCSKCKNEITVQFEIQITTKMHKVVK
jgi:transcription elongation factor Elf1